MSTEGWEIISHWGRPSETTVRLAEPREKPVLQRLSQVSLTIIQGWLMWGWQLIQGESFGETKPTGRNRVPLWWQNSHKQEEAEHIPVALISVCRGSFRRENEIISKAQDTEKQRQAGIWEDLCVFSVFPKFQSMPVFNPVMRNSIVCFR